MGMSLRTVRRLALAVTLGAAAGWAYGLLQRPEPPTAEPTGRRTPAAPPAPPAAPASIADTSADPAAPPPRGG